jgi:hypothetical protein
MELIIVDNSLISGRDIPELVNHLKIENPVGIEIGVDEAMTSEYLLDNIPNLKLFGVDPYASYVDWNGNNLDQSGRNATYDKMRSRLDKFGSSFKHHRMISDDAVGLFEDDSVDFIFIDGLHEYDQVLKDCRSYWPKVKKGGLFAGHDFGAIEGVRKAVEKFAEEVGVKLINHKSAADIWYWIKD